MLNVCSIAVPVFFVFSPPFKPISHSYLLIPSKEEPSALKFTVNGVCPACAVAVIFNSTISFTYIVFVKSKIVPSSSFTFAWTKYPLTAGLVNV